MVQSAAFCGQQTTRIANRFVAFVIVFICSFVITKVGAEDPIVTNKVHCRTTKGDINLDIYRDWSPLGADRFIELVEDGFFQDIAFFRCVKRFLTQFGISDKAQYKHWHNQQILDDPNLHKGIKRGYLSFAGGGANTRSTQLFIAFEDLDFLGNEPWETPFGKVTEGYDTLDALYKGYGDIPPFGKGPDQQKIHNRGNAYLRENFPLVDYILSCEVTGSEVVQQTAFNPETHRAESVDVAEGEPAVVGRDEELKVVAQTPFDPQIHKNDQERDHTLEEGNLRVSSAEAVKIEAPKVMSMKKILLVLGIFIIGVGVAVMVTVHLRKRLVSITKSN